MAVGFAYATWFWTSGRNDLSGEYLGAAVALAEAVDRDSLVATRLKQYRLAKERISENGRT